MTYLYRLSHRLAASLIAVLVVGACGKDIDPTGPAAAADTTQVAPPQSPPSPQSPPTPATHSGWFVAPNGSPSNDGSSQRPWSLSHALGGANGRIAAGDTVWLRSGTYRDRYRTSIAGTASRPIVFRQYPGERATIDGSLTVDGADVVFWGFEVMQSAPLGYDKESLVTTYGARTKFINLIVHDANQQGINFWDGADNGEVYGCIVYNNGTHGNFDHGIYVHNSSSGTKVLADNVFFNNLSYGVHVYAGPEDAAQRNVHVIGNVAFNNGSISSEWPERVNVLIGGDVPGSGMRAIDNQLYFSGSTGVNMRIGFNAANRDIEVRGNTVWGGKTALMVGQWSNATFAANRIGGNADMVEMASASGQTWSGNEYYRSPAAPAWLYSGSALAFSTWKGTTGASDVAWSSTPTSPSVVVRPNKYEAGRGLIVVYNWTGTGSVSVDVSRVLRTGQRYEVRNVQAMFGAPVLSGTYSGGNIALPMNGVAPPPRLGRSTRTPPRTAPYFDTFVVIPIS